MKNMKQTVLVVLSALLILSLAACGSTGSGATQAPTAGATSPGAAGTSAKELVYEQIAKDPLGLNGIPERNLESRASIAKGLPQAQRGSLTVGYTAPFMGSAFFTTLADRMQELCDDKGYTLIVQNANTNIQTQIAQVEAFITQKVDVIILNGLDLPSCVPVMRKAVEAGIPVLATGGRAGLPEYPEVTSIVSNSFQSGWMCGTYAAQNLYKSGETIKTAWVIIDLGSADSESRSCGFLSGYLYQARKMAGNPYPTQFEAIWDGYQGWKKLANEGALNFAAECGLEVVGLGQSHQPDISGGQKASADIITGHPDVKLIFCENDSMFAGVDVNLRQNNLEAGKDVSVVCPADGVQVGLQYVKEGKIMALGNNSSLMIAEGMITLIEKIFEQGYDANNLPGVVFTPTDAITQENLSTYWNGTAEIANGIPYDFQNIDEYNAAAQENDNPFPVP
jgi:ribose transport system substrate-binding protein